jgi:hypothetical protein
MGVSLGYILCREGICLFHTLFLHFGYLRTVISEGCLFLAR